jgi:signal transduction histidine kinase
VNDAEAHGLHRWQQGYDLREVTRELGRLNECVLSRLDACTTAQGELQLATMAAARRIWARQFGVAIGESTATYYQLQQLEAAGHVNDLEQALVAIRELEAQRSELWQQAAHDLRGNLGVVKSATTGLTRSGVPDARGNTFLRLLERNVASLHQLLDDVTSLARLQAGKELRTVAPLDAGVLLGELCDGLRGHAEQRGLYLVADGPASFATTGDAVKIRRIAQNLILNAVKYTRQGGVTVSWGDSSPEDGDRWRVCVADTGPGLTRVRATPFAGALETATELTRQLDAEGRAGVPATGLGGMQAPASSPGADPAYAALAQGGGEGIGLSIVKRLCELLDAGVELETAAHTGTRFTILLPRAYPA